MKKETLDLYFEIIIQIAIFLFFFVHIPPEYILNTEPATGGDTGSHFWALYVMKELGWNTGDFSIKFWNAGNYLGEPLFVHYFPLPFILMALLSYIMPLGTAFNIISIIGPMTLPLSLYICCKLLKLKNPIPSLVSILSLAFLFNDSFSILGGNINSTLAGQFAHSISMNTFIIAFGLLYNSMQKNKFPYLALVFFSITALSHAYAFFFTPFLFLAYLLVYPSKKSFITLFNLGLLILAFSAWYLGPMIDNNKWQTNYSLVIGWNHAKEILMSNYNLYTWLATAPFILITLFKWRSLTVGIKKILLICLFMIGIHLSMYYIFPLIGLVDGRIIPNVTLFNLIVMGISIGTVFSFFNKEYLKRLSIIITMIGTIALVQKYNKTVINWVKWNYNSWNKKPLASSFYPLNETLKGNLNQPRIAYENSSVTNGAGTIRAFEMLPYFANRATTEGLYMQSTIMAGPVFYFQSKISKTPSCPYGATHRCTRYGFENAKEYMQLLGINQIIVNSKEVIEKADQYSEIEKLKEHKPWIVYNAKFPVNIVSVVDKDIKVESAKDWKKSFYDWFLDYPKKSHFLVRFRNDSEEKAFRSLSSSSVKDQSSCKPEVLTDMRGFNLKTNCPNQPHLVRFSYHSTFETNDQSNYFAISPGFILAYPKSSDVRFEFGKRSVWRIFNFISIIAFLGVFGFYFYERKKLNSI